MTMLCMPLLTVKIFLVIWINYENCVIDMKSISAPSFRKIPLRLSRPAAFDVLVLFKVSKTISIDTWLKVKGLFLILRLL